MGIGNYMQINISLEAIEDWFITHPDSTSAEVKFKLYQLNSITDRLSQLHQGTFPVLTIVKDPSGHTSITYEMFGGFNGG
jgi:hypothetical protein